MFEAFLMAISPTYLMYMTIGVLLGLVVGTLPGLTATMGTALLVPFTFGLPTGEGIAMLGGLYVCAMFSDATLTVLSNKNNPIVEVRFSNMYPVSLGALEFNQQATDVEYMTVSADFTYQLYEIHAL